MTDDLTRLAALHAAGSLTDAEFAAAKAAVVGAPVPGVDLPRTPVPDPPEKGSLAGFWIFVGLLVLFGSVAAIKVHNDRVEREVLADAATVEAARFGFDSPASTMDGIERQVATDAAGQYAIVARSGSGIDHCVHAGIVAAAYLQANDSPAYERWKATERADCAAIGLNR